MILQDVVNFKPARIMMIASEANTIIPVNLLYQWAPGMILLRAISLKLFKSKLKPLIRLACDVSQAEN